MRDGLSLADRLRVYAKTAPEGGRPITLELSADEAMGLASALERASEQSDRAKAILARAEGALERDERQTAVVLQLTWLALCLCIASAVHDFLLSVVRAVFP